MFVSRFIYIMFCLFSLYKALTVICDVLWHLTVKMKVTYLFSLLVPDLKVNGHCCVVRLLMD